VSTYCKVESLLNHNFKKTRRTAMNFNPPMCKAAKVCIAEVEEIVEIGEIPAEHVHVPSIYVKRVVLGKNYQKRIEVCLKVKFMIKTLQLLKKL